MIITATRARRAQWQKGSFRDIPGFVAAIWYPVILGLSYDDAPEPGLAQVFGFLYTIDSPTLIEMMSYTYDFGGPRSEIRIDYEANESGPGNLRRLTFKEVFFMGFGRSLIPSDHFPFRQSISGTGLNRIPFRCAISIFGPEPISDYVTDTVIG